MTLPSPNEGPASVKTKIIATVGPACGSPAALRELVQAGVDIFRLNFAHGTHDWLTEIVATIRQLSVELRRPIGILGDLAGPKIRLEELPGGLIHCQSGEQYEFVRRSDSKQPQQLTCTYESLIDELNPGDRVLLADGTVSFVVAEKHAAAGRVVCTVEQSGDIRSRQGINLPGVALSTPSLTAKDRDDLAWAVRQGIDFVGLSFVRSPDDIRLLRQVIAELQPASPPQIVAKIEKREAVDQLEQILDLTDAVMVARGDLGVEVDLALVPTIQKRIIRLCNERRVPVITATQMLDSMTHNNRPTRAEATDVANAVLDGTDAVMLSGETAAGDYPTLAVTTMSRICREAERSLAPHPTSDAELRLAHQPALAVTEAVALGAARVAEQLAAALVVVATHSGKTAMALSQQRCRTPVLGVSDSPETTRRLCLYWGITPLQAPQTSGTVPELLQAVVAWGKAHSILHAGARIVLVTSTQWSADGHDLILVHQVPQG